MDGGEKLEQAEIRKMKGTEFFKVSWYRHPNEKCISLDNLLHFILSNDVF